MAEMARLRLLNRARVTAVGVLFAAASMGTAGWSSNPAWAQADEAETVVRVPRETLETPVSLPERPEVETLGEAIGHLDIYVDGERCGRLDLTDEAHRDDVGDARIDLASADAAACTREGADVVLVDGNGLTLHEKFVLRPGEEIVVTNLAPEPPHADEQPPAPGAPAAGTGLAPQHGKSLPGTLLVAVGAVLMAAGAAALLVRNRRTA
jgi:hypothetical protein